jgi:hypothetical protein
VCEDRKKRFRGESVTASTHYTDRSLRDMLVLLSEGMPELVVGFLEQRDDGRHVAGLLEVLTILG